MKLTSKAAINVEKVFPTPKRKGSKRSINEASENSSTPFTRGEGGGDELCRGAKQVYVEAYLS